MIAAFKKNNRYCFYKHIIAISILLMLNSCFPAYRIYPKPDKAFKVPLLIENIYVINKDSLPREYTILKHSKLYTFTEDSTSQNKIRLYPMEKAIYVCGNAMIGSMISFGIIPTRFPDKYIYKYDLIGKDAIISHQMTLDISQHLWLFNIFSNKRNFKKQAGLALAITHEK